MTIDQLSAILEIVAFVLITPEFLGHPRLTALVSGLRWFPQVKVKYLTVSSAIFLVLLAMTLLFRRNNVPPSDDPQLDRIRLLILAPFILATIQAGIVLFMGIGQYIMVFHAARRRYSQIYFGCGAICFLVAKALLVWKG